MGKRRDEELEALRAFARERHRAAGKKVSYYKTNRETDLTGTKYDPRRAIANIEKYNRRQLQSYVNQLTEFTSRQTRFHLDAHGGIITSKKWREYKQAERARNRRIKREWDKVDKIFDPDTGMTVGQSRDAFTPTHPTAANPTVNARRPINRKPNQVASESKLKKLTKQQMDYAKANFRKKEQQRFKRIARDMLRTVNRPDLIKELRKLTDAQFKLLWTNEFVNLISEPYESAKAQMSEKGKYVATPALENNLERAKAKIAWAGSQELGS